MNREIAHIRKDFIREALDEESLAHHPVHQFKLWLNEAIENNEAEPTAMTLCTVSSEGVPSARVVLLKQVDEISGFWFFTNYDSHKGMDLKHNPHAAINFFWPGLERQVRITGVVNKVSKEDSDIYFNSRPLDSRAGAIASPQSQVIQSRKELENWFEQAKKGQIKRPLNWGGYALTPNTIEFWQGRAGRLHDRIKYRLTESVWIKERLAP